MICWAALKNLLFMDVSGKLRLAGELLWEVHYHSHELARLAGWVFEVHTHYGMGPKMTWRTRRISFIFCSVRGRGKRPSRWRGGVKILLRVEGRGGPSEEAGWGTGAARMSAGRRGAKYLFFWGCAHTHTHTHASILQLEVISEFHRTSVVCKPPQLRWARSRESYRRIASDSYRSDSNH